MKPIIVIPTYNERDNIRELVGSIRAEVKSIRPDILVVDSASPDGTADTVRAIKERDPMVHLISQNAKLGLGRAYLDGMQWALERDYDSLVTMDADFSHHPRYLDLFFRETQKHDLVVGSRYIKGGELRNWPLARRFLSRFANGYARLLTGLPFSDLTGGFHCFRADLLKKILRYHIHSEGYAFLMELKSLAILQGARYKEIPIIFSDRTRGDSKISKRVILEAVFFVLKRMGQRSRFRDASSLPARAVPENPHALA